MKIYFITIVLLLCYGMSAQGEPDFNAEADPEIPIGLCDLPNQFLESHAINENVIMPMFSDGVTINTFAMIPLNPRELRFMMDHPFESIAGASCMIEARKRSEGPLKYANTLRDAKRHTFWAACMTAVLGPEIATQILANHENGSSDVMDATNNAYGVNLGKTLKGKTFDQIWDAVVAAADRGELMVVDKTPTKVSNPKPNSPPAQSVKTGETGDRSTYSGRVDVKAGGDTKTTEPKSEPKTEPKETTGDNGGDDGGGDIKIERHGMP